MKNKKNSIALTRVWKEKRGDMMKNRLNQTPEQKEVHNQKIRQHFIVHPEHRTAISNAQKKKWAKYKKALQYCKLAGINLEVD